MVVPVCSRWKPAGRRCQQSAGSVPTLIKADETLISERFCKRLRTTTDVIVLIALIAQALGLDEIPASVDALLSALQQIPPRIIALDDAHLFDFQ